MPRSPAPQTPSEQLITQGALGGLFVVLEGIDGAGTTTQTQLLTEALIQRKIDVHATREPSTGPIGKLLREILAGGHQVNGGAVSDATLGLLFAADRADHVQREILPALARGAVVVSDRYDHSSLAYQGEGEAFSWVRTLNSRVRRPDLTLLLALPAQVAAARRAAAGRPDELFDALTTQERVARGYLRVVVELGQHERIEVLDGTLPVADLHADILARVLAARDQRA
jgi:dTMP kinase